MQNNNSSNGLYTQAQLYALSLKVMENIDELFAYLDICVRRDKRMYVGPCPIHEGDNNTAFNLYHLGENCCGNWKCRSHGCHNYFANNVIGFVRGLLSHREHSWNTQNDPTVSLKRTIEYLLSFLETDINSLKVDSSKLEKRRFISNMQCLEVQNNKPLINRSAVRKSLNIPAKYYLDRGYTSQILNRYDIGLCNNYKKAMYNRVVVPVYDNNYKFMVGCSGRSIFKQCNICMTWHDPNIECPTQETKQFYTKWKHSHGFYTNLNLYNYWNAAKHIKKTGVAVIVESPGNCWRLEEAGIFNSVGLFGNILSTQQRMILDASGALTLVIIMDNDINNAGQEAAECIKKQCERIYNIVIIEPTKNDIGDMTVQETQIEIVPQIKELEYGSSNTNIGFIWEKTKW